MKQLKDLEKGDIFLYNYHTFADEPDLENMPVLESYIAKVLSKDEKSVELIDILKLKLINEDKENEPFKVLFISKAVEIVSFGIEGKTAAEKFPEYMI